MFKIRIYKDAQGKQPIKEHLTKLADKTDKDSRIKLGKIDYCLQALRKYGTLVGEPFVKHIDGDIWELRPLNDRFFFFCWQGNSFILLHHFVKKTKKTPLKEIEQAKRNQKDFIKRGVEMMKNKPISPMGDDWDSLRKALLTQEERAETDIKVALLGEIISARQSSGLTQKELETVSGVRQPVIARLERGNTDPQLSTLIRVLAPLGKTLAIVPLDQGIPHTP